MTSLSEIKRGFFSWFPKEWKRPSSQKETLHPLWSNKTFTPRCTTSACSSKSLGNLKQKKCPWTWVTIKNPQAYGNSKALFWKIPVNTAQLFPAWGERWLALRADFAPETLASSDLPNIGDNVATCFSHSETLPLEKMTGTGRPSVQPPFGSR